MAVLAGNARAQMETIEFYFERLIEELPVEEFVEACVPMHSESSVDRPVPPESREKVERLEDVRLAGVRLADEQVYALAGDAQLADRLESFDRKFLDHCEIISARIRVETIFIRVLLLAPQRAHGFAIHRARKMRALPGSVLTPSASLR